MLALTNPSIVGTPIPKNTTAFVNMARTACTFILSNGSPITTTSNPAANMKASTIPIIPVITKYADMEFAT